jgi:hypothetical protein
MRGVGAKLATAAASMLCFVLILPAGSPGGSAHREGFEADALTITVDRAARAVSGTLVADSFYWHVCWGDGDARIKIRREEPGRDKTIGEDPYQDWDHNWMFRFHGTANKGKKIYAETPGFGSCPSIRSRTVTAP